MKRKFSLSSTETLTRIGKYVDTLDSISIPELTKHLHQSPKLENEYVV